MEKAQNMVISVSIELSEQLISSITESVIDLLNNKRLTEVNESLVAFRESNVDSSHKELESLPDIITPQQVANYLQISRKSVYELLSLNPDHGGISSFKIGNSRRVERVDFEDWLRKKRANFRSKGV